MTGHELSVLDLPPMSGEEWAKLAVKQAERIAELTAQLKARDRDVRELRAEQDAELWRAGVGL